MSGNKILLDTNAVVALIVGHEEVKEVVEQYDSHLLPVIVLGELIYGAEKSAKKESNREKIRTFQSGCEVLNIDEKTAEFFGIARNALRAKGRPIPDNDLWIAAIALEHNVPILTQERHFEVVDQIQKVTW